MGSQQFQREYIDYLQSRNADLMNQLGQIKEHYENKIFSKDLNKHITTSLDKLLTVCTTLPQEVDIFFEKMTAAMNALTTILIKKSEMVDLVNKISPYTNIQNKAKEGTSDSLDDKKIDTVRVAPMINGHIILTEPRICLNRLTNNVSPQRNRLGFEALSPIIETSPMSNVSSYDTSVLKEPIIMLERIDLMDCDAHNENEQQLKLGLKVPLGRCRSSTSKDNNNSPVIPENKEESSRLDMQCIGDNIDPLEGPSWLYNETNTSSSQLFDAPHSFVNQRRRRHRFANVFDKNHEQINSSKRSEIERNRKTTSEVGLDERQKIQGSNTTRVDNEMVCVKCSPVLQKERSFSPEYIAETPRKAESLKLPTKDTVSRKTNLKLPVVALHNCMLDENSKNTPRGTSSTNNDESKFESCSSNMSNEGRKRRKAAPKNLCEPKLSTKLRRN